MGAGGAMGSVGGKCGFSGGLWGGYEGWGCLWVLEGLWVLWEVEGTQVSGGQEFGGGRWDPGVWGGPRNLGGGLGESQELGGGGVRGGDDLRRGGGGRGGPWVLDHP